MDFKKETPKWYRIVYSILLGLLGIFSICLLFKDLLMTPLMAWFMLFFVLFNIVFGIYFFAKKYELRAWAIPIAYIVFGYVGISLVNRFTTYMTIEGIYFLHFIKTVFLWFFILLALIVYLHPNIKKVQELKSKKEKKEVKSEKKEVKAEKKKTKKAKKKEKKAKKVKKGKKQEEEKTEEVTTEEKTEETTEIEPPKE